MAQLVKNLRAMCKTWVQSLGLEDPLEKERLPISGFLPGEFHGLYSPWGRKESDMTERLSLLHWLSRMISCMILSRSSGQQTPYSKLMRSVRAFILSIAFIGQIFLGLWNSYTNYTRHA